ncbi:hypothetical protein EG68_06096 [Paragonimus skrjabini miyazakii]|uniref:Uncharacterized protein n=1 Tax=Paragonimus skrjabini miyazakii TaxID=59628 RepID=A0A8S9YQC3_9TREM|nr:hypothetical protein EG68_06096 [Paragonimus skrjabini miyazakii]
MSRRHLESALVAGAFIESGLTPCFRFTRIRFVRYCFPPGYDSSTYDPDEAGAENQSSPTAAEGPAFTPHSTLTTTCTCCPDPQSGITSQKSNEDGVISAMLGKGDCEAPSPVGTSPCKLHTEEYLIKHPWRRLHDDYAIHSVQFSPDGKQLLAGSANTSIRVIQTTDGSQRLLPRPSKWTLGMPITAIRFMPPKLVWAVACNSHGEVFAFNPEREGFETLFKEPQQTYALDFSPDGTELATGGVDKKIRIYTLQPGSVLGMPAELHDPCESATDGDILPDGMLTIVLSQQQCCSNFLAVLLR